MKWLTVFIISTFALFAGSANAEVTQNDSTDIFLVVFVPCANGGAGEIVELSGPLHTLLTSTINGNNVSGKFHFQPQGVSGLGLTTGAKYNAVGVTQQTFKTSLQNGQANLTFVNNFRIIGHGRGNNLQIHEEMHITWNADGTQTVNHDNISIDCN